MSKKDNKVIIKKVILYIILIAVACFTIYNLYNLILKPAATFVVENGKLSEEQTVNGYIIRDEEVIKGENYKNGMQKIKLEGEKVAKGEAVFRYYVSGEEDIVKKIEELDIQISQVLEQEQSSIFKADIKTIENSIQDKIASIYKLNDIQKIKEYKQDINNYINKKAKIAGESSPQGSYLRDLISQRSELENELNKGSEYIKANKAGIVSYRIDGLEEKLTVSNFEVLNKGFLNELNLKTGQVVSTSEEGGKIVNNYYCYIACVLDVNDREINVGNTIKIRLSNNAEVNGKIVHIYDENDKEKLIVFRIDKCVEDLINYRKISFDIIWWSETGLKVANEAIKVDTTNGLKYVVRKRNGYTDKIYIKILKQNDNYSIISNYTRDELLNTSLEKSEVEWQAVRQISIYDEISI